MFLNVYKLNIIKNKIVKLSYYLFILINYLLLNKKNII